ncbi:MULTISPECIES: FlgB family protein [Tabrizicola]|uniref:FlgB family protein n=1 Tax=Tabrizicola TaxID=1443919 RepID=UPI001081215B|nr:MULTISPECIES: FlgB family protein [Paracoccaceae]
MFEKLELARMAQALAAHSGARMAVIARNIAHADTPGYKAQDLPSFASVLASEGGEMRATRPGHLRTPAGNFALTPQTAPGRESPNGNTVSLEGEMVKSVEVRQSHDMALAIYRATSDVIRASLGRSR